MKAILKLFLCFSGLFLVYDNCYCQVNIDALSGGSFDVEYCCTTPYQNYEIPFIAFKVSNLDYGAYYSISLDSAEIFDVIGWESKSRYFIADGTYWKWNHPTITTDTIILEAQGDYANLELDTYQCFRMGISHLGIGDLAGVCIFIKTSMSISGPSLDCDNPVSYNLLNIPDDLASAEWELKQYSIT